MNSQSEEKQKYMLYSFRIDKKTKLKQGDIVKILDQNGDILEFAYLVTDMKVVNGYPFITIKTQKTEKTIEMILTNAIQKI
jgi:hypothetical protein